MFRRTVFCSFQFVAFHNWPDAPDHVDFLRNTHRHLFKVVASADVDHNNRDIEFTSMKDMIAGYCEKMFAGRNLGSMSCEDIAQDILEAFTNLCSVSVSEDGENGAVLRRLDNTEEA